VPVPDPAVDVHVEQVDEPQQIDDVVRSILRMTAATRGPIC
jgi:hypothetical protein